MKQKPLIFIVSAPASSCAHNALISFLLSLKEQGRSTIKVFMSGAAAAVAQKDTPLASLYHECAETCGFKLLVCGMAAKELQISDSLHSSFVLSGFAELLSDISLSHRNEIRTVNW